MRAATALVSLALLAAFPALAAPAKPSATLLPIEDGYVDTGNGVLIYWKAFGAGEPLLVLHGGPGASHDYLLPGLVPLARHNRLVFIDERGSGRSPRLDDPKLYTLANMADDVEAVRLALHLGKVHLMGHSCGGNLALTYALKYPDSLRSLHLASTFASTRRMNGVLARIKAAMPADSRKRLEELEAAGLYGKGKPWERGRYPAEYMTLAWGEGYFPYLYGERPDPNWDPQANGAGFSWELYREMWGDKGEFVISGNLASFEVEDRLGEIGVPTLITVGDHDECDPSLARAMQERIPGSRLVVLPNAGHMTFVDQPAAFVSAVETFLAGTGKKPAAKEAR